MKDKNQTNSTFTQPFAGAKTECSSDCHVKGIPLGKPQSLLYNTDTKNMTLTIATDGTAGRALLYQIDKTKWELRIAKQKDSGDQSTLVATLHAIQV